jgi:hypothetical protein
MRNAQGRSLDWKDKALCRSATGIPLDAWKVERSDGKKLKGVPAEAWIALALENCAICTVQYDCTRFALAVEERWHTWGVDIRDLKWMQKNRELAERIIDIAETQGVPVQVAVRSVRERSHDMLRA